MSSTSPSSAAAGGGADASATTARSQSLAAATGSSPGSRQRKTLHERQGSKESTDSNVLPPPPPDDSPMALKKQNAQLREEVKRLKESMSSLVSSAEAEEEYITNKLMKKLSTLKQEKEKLALEVDREEEFLTNTLQKKLSKVQEEKEEAQKKLDEEQEYVVNKLRRELSAVVAEKQQLEDQLKQEQEQLDKKAAEFAKEKQELEDKLRREEKHIEETLRAKLDRVLHEKVELENKLEQEQEYIVNKLQHRLNTVTKQKEDLEKQLCSAQEEVLSRLNEIVTDMASKATEDQMPVIARMQNEIQKLQKHRDTVQTQYQTLKQGNESLEADIKRLNDEKFTLSQKLAAEKDRAEQLAKQNSELTLNLEVDSERAFNESTRSRSGSNSFQGGTRASFAELSSEQVGNWYGSISPEALNQSESDISADALASDQARANILPRSSSMHDHPATGLRMLPGASGGSQQQLASRSSTALDSHGSEWHEQLYGRERSVSSGGLTGLKEKRPSRSSSLLGAFAPPAPSTSSHAPFTVNDQFTPGTPGTPTAPSVGLHLDLDSGDTHAHFARTLVDDDVEGKPICEVSGAHAAENLGTKYRHKRSASYTVGAR